MLTAIAKIILIIIGVISLGVCFAAAKEWEFQIQMCRQYKEKLSDHFIHLYMGLGAGGLLCLCVYLYGLL